VSFPKVLDLYDICSEDLKKSLDLGREFARKIREEEDSKRLEGKSDDVEMKDQTNNKNKEEEKLTEEQ
jgi:ubiquitin carboxyl-terminal hydrolase 14